MTNRRPVFGLDAFGVNADGSIEYNISSPFPKSMRKGNYQMFMLPNLAIMYIQDFMRFLNQ